MNKQKGLAPILIVLLIALAVGGYLIYQKQLKPASQSQPIPVQTLQNESIADETTNWKTYTAEKYGFSFKYPQDYETASRLSVQEYRRYNEENLALFSIDTKVNPDGKIIEGIGLTAGVITPKSQVELDAETMGNKGDPFNLPDINIPALDASFSTYKTTSSADVSIIIGKPPRYAIHFACDDPRQTGKCPVLLAQILSTFKFLDQDQYEVIDKSVSPDKSYVVIKSTLGDDLKLTIKDNKDNIIIGNVLDLNDEVIMVNLRKLGLVGGGMIGYSVKEWKNNSMFVLQISPANGSEFEVIINAKTGEVDGTSFKKIK